MPGHMIVGTPRERSTEPGFHTRQVVANLRDADGELWHGRQASSLLTLRIERIRTANDSGKLASSSGFPVTIAHGDWLILAFTRPLDEIGGFHWTRICNVWDSKGQNEAVQRVNTLTGPIVLARVHGLHHVQKSGRCAWTWQVDGKLVPE